MRRSGYIFIGSVILLGGVSVALIINRKKKKVMYDTLIGHLAQGINQTGTIMDYGSSAKQPFHPLYYKEQGAGTLLITVASAQALAKKIKAEINKGILWFTDESTMISFFKGLKNKAQVSFLADQYQKLYKSDMLKDITDAHYSLFGYSNPLAEIKSIVDQMPNK
jgi:hypothetical protein